jgi:hypothetical protein
MSYYVYENWVAYGHCATVHEAACPRCNYGRGQRSKPSRTKNGSWYGPFSAVAEARAAHLRYSDADWRACKVCQPY